MRQFVKFGLVGASGLVVNAVIAHGLEKLTPLSHFVDFAVGYMVGGISNYFLNRIWTFRSSRNAAIEGAQFLLVSFLSLLCGRLVFYVADIHHFAHFTTTWFIATVGGIFINFFVNKYWTFKHVS